MESQRSKKVGKCIGTYSELKDEGSLVVNEKKMINKKIPQTFPFFTQ